MNTTAKPTIDPYCRIPESMRKNMLYLGRTEGEARFLALRPHHVGSAMQQSVMAPFCTIVRRGDVWIGLGSEQPTSGDLEWVYAKMLSMHDENAQ